MCRILFFIAVYSTNLNFYRMSKEEKTIDLTLIEAVEKTGAFGRFQFVLAFVYLLAWTVAGMMCIQFQSLSIMQPIQCLSERCVEVTTAESEPLEQAICQLEAKDWEYSGDKSNWLTEFELYCDKAYLKKSGTSIDLTGFLFAAFICGYFSDKFGRRITNIICFAAYFVAFMMLKYATVLDEILFLRFMLGAIHGGLSVSLFTTLIEFTTPVYAWACSVLGICAFNVGGGIMGYIALERDQWASTLDIPVCISLIGLAICHFVIPETSHWFYAQGKELHALVALNEAAIINRSLRLRRTHLISLDSAAVESQLDTIFAVTLRTNFLKDAILRLAWCWFCVAMSYHALRYSKVPGSNEYYGIMARGVSGVPVSIIMFFTAQKFGANKTAKLFLGLLALALTLGSIPFLESAMITSSISVKTLVTCVGRGIAGSLFALLYAYTASLLPTLSRCSTLGICFTAAAFASILSPGVMFLDALSPMLIYAVTIVLAVVSLLVVQKMPEALHYPLPSNLAECELLFANRLRDTGLDFTEMENLLVSREMDETED